MCNPTSILRNPLLVAKLGNRNLTTVKIDSVILKGGQKGGLHLHPCPVVGYIAAGKAMMQIEGEAECILEAGMAFCEPADTRISEFGNYSDTEDLVFIAIYLLNGEQETIIFL